MPKQTMAVNEAVDRAWSALLSSIEQFPEARNAADIRRILCRGARELCEADGVTFVLRDGSLCHYVDEDALTPMWKGQRFPATACISGWCMINRQVAVIDDIYTDARIPHDVYRATFVKSMVMVPVRMHDPVAAIGTYWAAQHTPSAHTVQMLETLARASGTAILALRSASAA